MIIFVGKLQCKISRILLFDVKQKMRNCLQSVALWAFFMVCYGIIWIPFKIMKFFRLRAGKQLIFLKKYAIL